MTIIREELATICGFLAFAVIVLLGRSLAPETLGGAGSMGMLMIVFMIMLWSGRFVR